MSIYATLWHRKIAGEYIWAQGVPGHIGWEDHPEGAFSAEGTFSAPYYDSFLPPRVPEKHRDDGTFRAVVFVDDNDTKDGQRYLHPLLVITGAEYRAYLETDTEGTFSKRLLPKRLAKIIRDRRNKSS